MITCALLGCGTGIGLWMVAVHLFPPKPALGVVLARATAPPPVPDPGDTGWAARLGRPAVAPLRALGLPGARLTRDLAVIGRSSSAHLAEKAVFAVAGLLLPALLTMLLALCGADPGAGFPLLCGLLLAVVGFVLPDLRARALASRLREDFRHALSAYLDLVWITVAGGAGVDSALGGAVAVGRGWAFERIRRALDTSRLTRTAPWTPLRELGEELDVVELVELAASVSLVGTEGAKVRSSLAAKASAMRNRQVIEAERQAQAATERMSLPVVLLLLGFLAFIAHPAVTQVLNGL
ncbi:MULTISPECIES: type II secretion system F family protein [Actinosynnema]|uniref:type II secretion system F family protein n=1 Tax=Actinosynnema TaxID=40566 RepID=UPI0020A535DC|nr:type II secretion system F family protein [Actinosynnema pretiosum]